MNFQAFNSIMQVRLSTLITMEARQVFDMISVLP